mgnify:CR=1 FL=1
MGRLRCRPALRDARGGSELTPLSEQAEAEGYVDVFMVAEIALVEPAGVEEQLHELEAWSVEATEARKGVGDGIVDERIVELRGVRSIEHPVGIRGQTGERHVTLAPLGRPGQRIEDVDLVDARLELAGVELQELQPYGP